jgi:hypothetical protein
MEDGGAGVQEVGPHLDFHQVYIWIIGRSNIILLLVLHRVICLKLIGDGGI